MHVEVSLRAFPCVRRRAIWRANRQFQIWRRSLLLLQVGTLDPSDLPVSGDEQAAKLLEPDRSCNELIARAATRPEPA